MTLEDHEWPDPLDGEYELRLTLRALEDLGAKACGAADLDGVAAVTGYPDIVEKFAKVRALDPRGTEAPLSKVHRADIYKLDGRDGQRAVTWHDTAHAVVWLLGFTPEHDYNLFVSRAGTAETRGAGGDNQLMPSTQDYLDLADERGGHQRLDRVIDGLLALVERARTSPEEVARGTLAHAVRAEAAISSSPDGPRLSLRFRMPPIEAGLLPSGFEYEFIVMLPEVLEDSVDYSPFPGVAVHGAITVSALLRSQPSGR